jgi:hypothetical protein
LLKASVLNDQALHIALSSGAEGIIPSESALEHFEDQYWMRATGTDITGK